MTSPMGAPVNTTGRVGKFCTLISSSKARPFLCDKDKSITKMCGRCFCTACKASSPFLTDDLTEKSDEP